MRKVVLALSVISAACNGETPIRPSPSVEQISPSPSTITQPAVTDPGGLTIISGWDRAPVEGAIVQTGPNVGITDSKGRVSFAVEFGMPLDVDATGFLPRKTTVRGSREISLWPAANPSDAQAIRAMVYRPNFRGETSTPADAGSFYISFLNYGGLDVSTVHRVWAMEAKRFGEVLGLSYEVSSSFQYETNEVAVRFEAGGSDCTVSALGFCRIPPLSYKIFAVDPSNAIDPVVIRRVLASWFLGPNPLPGLMNPEAPTQTLSLLEEQAIRLSLQRPFPNRYPDTDR